MPRRAPIDALGVLHHLACTNAASAERREGDTDWPQKSTCFSRSIATHECMPSLLSTHKIIGLALRTYHSHFVKCQQVVAQIVSQ